MSFAPTNSRSPTSLTRPGGDGRLQERRPCAPLWQLVLAAVAPIIVMHWTRQYTKSDLNSMPINLAQQILAELPQRRSMILTQLPEADINFNRLLPLIAGGCSLHCRYAPWLPSVFEPLGDSRWAQNQEGFCYSILEPLSSLLVRQKWFIVKAIKIFKLNWHEVRLFLSFSRAWALDAFLQEHQSVYWVSESARIADDKLLQRLLCGVHYLEFLPCEW